MVLEVGRENETDGEGRRKKGYGDTRGGKERIWRYEKGDNRRGRGEAHVKTGDADNNV